MVISAVSRAAGKILRKARGPSVKRKDRTKITTKGITKKKFVRVIKDTTKKKFVRATQDSHIKAKRAQERDTARIATTVLPDPQVRYRLVTDIVDEQVPGMRSVNSGTFELGLYRRKLSPKRSGLTGSELRSTEPLIPENTASSMKRYEAQVKAKELARDDASHSRRYGLGEFGLSFSNIRGAAAEPYTIRYKAGTTVPVEGLFGQTKGFKTVKTTAKTYSEDVRRAAADDAALDDYITGGGDGNAWSPPGGSESYAIFNKKGEITRRDHMYWGSGYKKTLKEIKELVHSGDVSYTKWKKARQVHPQVARIEKAAKAKRMIKVSGKEGKARGSLVFTDYYETPERQWAFMQRGDTWMNPDDGYGRFMVGTPTQDILSTIGIQGKKFKRKKLTMRNDLKRIRLAKKQVAIMEKDMATKKSDRWVDFREPVLGQSPLLGIPRTRNIKAVSRKRQGIVAGTGFAISGALLYGQHDSYKIKKSPKIKRGYTGRLIKTSRGFVQERKKGKR